MVISSSGMSAANELGAPLQKVADRWDSATEVYSYYSAKVFHGTALKLFDWVDASQAETILELGSGDGNSSIDFALMKKPSARLVCVDISRNMCALLRERMTNLEQLTKTGQVLGYRHKLLSKAYTTEEISKLEFKSPLESINELKVDIIHAAGEQVIQFVPEESADVLISSMCLHLTHEPQALLAQAFKALKVGGRAAFSMWGSKERSLQYALVDRIKSEFGIEKPNRPSFFSLGEQTATLIDLFRKTGFSDVVVWEEHVPFPKHDELFQRKEARTLLEWEWPQDKKGVLEQGIDRLVQLQNQAANEGWSVGLSVVCVGALKKSNPEN